MLRFRVQCPALSAHYVVVWQIRLVYKSWRCLTYKLVRKHSWIRGGNIIDWPAILWFDSITELLFKQIGAHFSERKYCQPHRWPFFSCQVKHLTLMSLCFPGLSQLNTLWADFQETRLVAGVFKMCEMLNQVRCHFDWGRVLPPWICKAQAPPRQIRACNYFLNLRKDLASEALAQRSEEEVWWPTSLVFEPV